MTGRLAGTSQVWRHGGSLLAGVLALAGCGYRLGGWRAPPSVRTVAVPTFDNRTFPLRREVEYELTSAVREEIQSRTPLRLVTSREADLVIRGSVREFRERVEAEGRRDQKTESTLRVVVDLVVEDYRNGRIWRQEVEDVEPFSIQRGESLVEARRRAIGNLAEKILLAVESW